MAIAVFQYEGSCTSKHAGITGDPQLVRFESNLSRTASSQFPWLSKTAVDCYGLHYSLSQYECTRTRKIPVQIDCLAIEIKVRGL